MFFLIVIVFVATLIDSWFFGGGFLVSSEWRASRGYVTIGVLVVIFLWWLLVLRAGRSKETKRTDLPIEEVRNGNWFLQPLLALVMLLATGAILLSHTLPKYAHELDRQHTETVPFVVAGTPGPEKRGCRATKATSPDFGEVTLCLPDRVASALPPNGTVYVSGDETRFGLAPRFYALDVPGTAPAQKQPEQQATQQQPATEGSGFNVNDILEQMGVDNPMTKPTPTVTPAPTTTVTTTILVPGLRPGKDKNR